MLIGGCDVGSATGKAVIMENGIVLAGHVIPSGQKPGETAQEAMNGAMEKAGISSIDEFSYIVGTGYGRSKVPFAQEDMSEITCHARGAHWLNPAVRTVVDIGGQDCKVISLDSRGKLIEFVMNDKCAAGTGRFFEAMARVLHCSLKDISSLSNQGKNPPEMSNQCVVFAESEVVTLISDEAELNDIIAAINISVSSRISSMVRRVGLIEELALTGGCSKNKGLAKALTERLEVTVKKLPQDPQIAGALGAALIAEEKMLRQSERKIA